MRVAPEEVEVTLVPRDDLTLAADRGLVIALDTHLTPELRAEAWAREAIRQIQELRKQQGLDVSDRIETRYNITKQSDPDGALQSAIGRFKDYIATETLSQEFFVADLDQEKLTTTLILDKERDLKMDIAIRRLPVAEDDEAD